MFRNLEKQTYLLYFKDGIIELLFGSMFILHAVNTWFDMEQIFRPYWLRVLLIPIAVALALAKELITKKRIGKVTFTKNRKKKSRKMFIVVVIAQVITLIVFYLAATGKIQTEQKSSLIALFIEFTFLILVFYALTFFTGYQTFLIAGLVFAFSTPFLILLNPELHHSNIRIGIMLTAGFSFCTFGTIRLVEFLKKYPKPLSNE
jgi:predicted neutral ceramidase superfamily lipid hydrolase